MNRQALTEPVGNYIPSHLKLIAYTTKEGGDWKAWPTIDLGTVYSHKMPKVQQSLHDRCVLRFPSSVEVSTIGRMGQHILTAHAFLFERGYVWDGYNGWRDTRFTEYYLDKIKTYILFGE